MCQKIDFFIAGVQKAGTTALFNILSRSDRMSVPNRKELHFFDVEKIDWDHPDYTPLNRAFSPRHDGALRFEATPIYTFWPSAMQRIRRYNPAAKIIILFRHPAFRAFSQWAMEKTRGSETLTFAEAMSETGRRRARPFADPSFRERSYFQRGHYADQVREVFKAFPKEQVLCLRTDQLWANPGLTLRRVEEFLNVSGLSALESGYVTPYKKQDFGTIDRQLKERLTEEYRAQIVALTDLTGLEFNDWLDPAYYEPMPSIASLHQGGIS